MSTGRAPPGGKRTHPLDVLYLVTLVATFAVTAVVLFLLSPDSWFHRHRTGSSSLLLAALGVTGALNLAIARAHGKIWMKSGAVYRAEHPKLFATYRSMTVVILFAVAAGIVALLFFLPPL
jgi:hypothetical protein